MNLTQIKPAISCYDYRLKEALPAGRAFVCLDTAEIPRALQQIFTSSILNVGGSD